VLREDGGKDESKDPKLAREGSKELSGNPAFSGLKGNRKKKESAKKQRENVQKKFLAGAGNGEHTADEKNGYLLE